MKKKLMEGDNQQQTSPSQGFWAESWKHYRRNTVGIIALSFVVFLTTVAIFAPAIAGTKPVVCYYKNQLYMPCLGYFNRSLESPIFTKDKFRGTYPKNLQEKDPNSCVEQSIRQLEDSFAVTCSILCQIVWQHLPPIF